MLNASLVPVPPPPTVVLGAQYRRQRKEVVLAAGVTRKFWPGNWDQSRETNLVMH